MKSRALAELLRIAAVMTLAIAMQTVSPASESGPGNEWRHYGSDSGGSRYSPLDQINRQNVHQLKPAWILHTGDLPVGRVNATFECTPLVVDGVMYVSTAFSNVIALDAETGKVLWTFGAKVDTSNHSYNFASRGVTFWRHGDDRRIFLPTVDGRLIALNAADGKPADSFGDNGYLDLKAGMMPPGPARDYGVTSPPVVYDDLVITGSAVADHLPQGPNGDVRAFNTRTGKLVWRFHSVPQPGEFGSDDWQGDSWKWRGGANVWAPMSVDEKRGIVFLPLTSASEDRYGGDRKGKNLFADCLVALDARTGKRLWDYQIVHHDLWDYDLPAQPNLVTVHRDGRAVPAVAQITKMGLLFLFDRLTGNPLFDIEERPVPASEIPGEQAWPTQPFPVKPPPVGRLGMTADEITDVTPESRAECLAILKNAVLAKVYTPPGFQTEIIFTGTMGGPNWGGASYDPVSNVLFVNSQDTAQMISMMKAREGSALPYVPRGDAFGRFWDSHNYPCQRPPWGTLSAIDLDTGAFRWQSTLGVVDDLIAKGIPPTGTSNVGGSIVTAGGLVFIAATNDSRFRAFDKDTGKEIWSAKLEASGHATPMTFLGPKTGKQFVVIAAGGGGRYNDTHDDAVVAFTLSAENQPPRVIRVTPPRTLSLGPPREPQGMYTPVNLPLQPIGFSHRKHTETGMKCGACHLPEDSGNGLKIPAAAQCMNCHQSIERDSPSIRKLAQFQASGEPIPWQRIYRLPAFVFFSHRKHLAAAVKCDTCHGPVGDREILWQEKDISMAACVECHKLRQASLECKTCHDMEH